MSSLARFVVLAASLLAFGCGSSPPPAPAAPPYAPTNGVDPANLVAQLPGYVDSYGKSWGETYRMSGYILVAQHDHILFQQGYGLADRGTKAAPDADTTFRVGSITKQFTAAAILRLAQEGKLAVTDPIGKLLPDYPAVGAKVTVRQLLEQTSGLPSYTDRDDMAEHKNRPHTPVQIMALFWDQPLEFTPGSQFRYSNSNYVVLGAIIEKVSGQPYGDYLRDHLFAPAGMTRTTAGDAPALANRALGYQRRGDALVEAEPLDMSFPYAAGNVRSTASDLLKWHRALSGGTILNAASRDELYRVGMGNYAAGWVIEERDGRRLVWHNGGIDGFHATFVRVPAADLVVIAWSNIFELSTDPIAMEAVRAAFGARLEPIHEDAKVALDPAVAPRLAGNYRLADGERERLAAMGLPVQVLDSIQTLEIGLLEGAIELHPIGQPPLSLVPKDAATYIHTAANLQVTFALDGTGPAPRLTIQQGPVKTEFVRADR
jgi:CubicO group peptidase (beta-lactamase class C family)